MGTITDGLIAWYPLDDTAEIGKDISGNGMDGRALGEIKPVIENYCGRKAAVFAGGASGNSYIQLPEQLLAGVDDKSGITVSAWVCEDVAASVWERIFDFGDGQMGPYLFLTRGMRGVCFKSSDLPADAGQAVPVQEWIHIAMTVSGTRGKTASLAGPCIYINGELVADGRISQTSSGTYKLLGEWWETLADGRSYANNYIGRSQFAADDDFRGAMTDFRVYDRPLDQEEILTIMCECMGEEQLITLAMERFLPSPARIIVSDQKLSTSLLGGRVKVEWSCNRPEFMDASGHVNLPDTPVGVRIAAVLSCGEEVRKKEFAATILPEQMPAYELTIHPQETVCDISKTLYGLFYEDINHAADGGIYAELVQNRSFEEFTFDTYDARSGENGVSTGRKREPLKFWFGDTDRVTVHTKGGILTSPDLAAHQPDESANACYITVPAGSCLYSRGFCDLNFAPSMYLKKGERYDFSVWSRTSTSETEGAVKIRVQLLDADENAISQEATIPVDETGEWKKYQASMTAEETGFGQLKLTFDGAVDIDFVSLIPGQVWGAEEEEVAPTAHSNYSGNSNYRLRRDLVQTLADMHPTFLRFPGGCISEGSYIWDNVYDWKDSVGPVECRRENYNVWGYTMTLGLGYMEYFQLAEDLGAEPLPVMACGVLCQARSDYANPAGGALREKYIANFTDLIDFAIGTDFSNPWAALRRDMGHEKPFGLHYLGVGNENWGTEFYANFELFKSAIDEHMKTQYPGYELHIVSTAGAQADDDSYQQGWKFLSGHMRENSGEPMKAAVAFTDGKESRTEEMQWYRNQPDYLDTIVDEHYYRSNEYLLENADRYQYYYRPYENGKLVEEKVSKVFVGEYASTDKNTLAGAVAEAAVMTGFENNSDVVRLAATAPLFNKVGTDGTYRWTPDAIWFDDTKVWRTPNYYVQKLFAENLGTRTVATSYATYEDGLLKKAVPRGGILIRTDGEVALRHLLVQSREDGSVLFEQKFGETLSPELQQLSDGSYYVDAPDWSNYVVRLAVEKATADAAVRLAVGVRGLDKETYSLEKLDAYEYCVGMPQGTGLKVYKQGKEGYTMGDYSSSVFAGNLRACYDTQGVAPGEYELTVDFGGDDRKHLLCYYESKQKKEKRGSLTCKLEVYNRDIYSAATVDDNYLYLKLVNAEAFAKRCRLCLNPSADENDWQEYAEWSILTADEALWHTPNVNTAEEEPVTPEKRTLSVEKNAVELTLPAYSVNVIKMRRRGL